MLDFIVTIPQQNVCEGADNVSLTNDVMHWLDNHMPTSCEKCRPSRCLTACQSCRWTYESCYSGLCKFRFKYVSDVFLFYMEYGIK